MLEENWDAVQVFQRCTQQWLSAGMAGAFAGGLSALEVDAACRLTGIAAGDLPEISCQVIEMGRTAAEEVNSRRK